MAGFDAKWKCFSSYSEQGVGRIWVLWNSTLYDFCLELVEGKVVMGALTNGMTNLCGNIACIYAANCQRKRHSLWSCLTYICSGWQGPGLVMGDFNAIRKSNEAFGGCPNLSEMEEFDRAILEADLSELRVMGNWFMWSNKVHGAGILRRLAKVLINEFGYCLALMRWFGCPCWEF